MPFKPNYGHQRAERARAQGARREEKLRQRQERSEERKAAAAAAEAVPKQGVEGRPAPIDPNGGSEHKD
ncbi:hypothetical protein FQU96_30570 [Reyranella sp. CPCC 100927]|nr:hypothetical protein FQU96_30570 [Reyranella sp. CPCC 100927]